MCADSCTSRRQLGHFGNGARISFVCRTSGPPAFPMSECHRRGTLFRIGSRPGRSLAQTGPKWTLIETCENASCSRTTPGPVESHEPAFCARSRMVRTVFRRGGALGHLGGTLLFACQLSARTWLVDCTCDAYCGRGRACDDCGR